MDKHKFIQDLEKSDSKEGPRSTLPREWLGSRIRQIDMALEGMGIKAADLDPNALKVAREIVDQFLDYSAMLGKILLLRTLSPERIATTVSEDRERVYLGMTLEDLASVHCAPLVVKTYDDKDDEGKSVVGISLYGGGVVAETDEGEKPLRKPQRRMVLNE